MPVDNKQHRSRFGIDILTLAGGTTIAQIIVILASPLLTRLYSPDTFGFLALFTSITGILGVVACLRYEYSIVLPKDDREATSLFGLSILIALLFSLCTVPLIILIGPFIAELLRVPELGQYLILIPLSVLLIGLFQALNYWNTRTRKFGRLSATRVVGSLATTGTQIGAGLVGYATGGSLISANILGSAVSTIVLGSQIWRDDRHIFKGHLSWRGMVAGLKQYKKFPLYDGGSAILNAASWQIPAFLLAAFFSPAIVGFYALGFRILHLPMSLVGNAIAQVFFQRAAEAEHAGNLAPLAEGVFRTLLKVGLFPMLVLTVAGEDLFSVVFGSAWAEAGVYAQILSVWAIFWFVSSPLTTIYLVKGRQEFGLKMNTIIFLTRLASLSIGGLLASPIIALLLFSASGVLVYGYLCFALLRICGISSVWIMKTIISIMTFFLPAGIVLILLEVYGISPVVISICAAVLVGVYYLYIIKTDPSICRVIPKRLQKVFFRFH